MIFIKHIKHAAKSIELLSFLACKNRAN